MAYTYQLTFATKTKTVVPRTVGKIVLAREDGEIFFREKMTGALELIGDDFDFLNEAKIYAVQCCQEISFQIIRQCGTSDPELFWQGYFTLYDIDWDFDEKSVSISKVSTRDRYNPVILNYSKEVNWLDGTDSFRFGTTPPANYQVLTPFKYQFPKTDDFNPTGSRDHNRARNFNNSLQWLIGQTMKDTAYESYGTATPIQFSQFLNADINPVTKKPNYLKEVSILHLSDAKRPGASNYATKGIVTLKAVLDDLKRLYNAYWFIDDDNRIRIEHISFFPHQTYDPPVVSLDLTSNEFKEVMSGSKKLSYQSDLLKGIEGVEFSISQSAQDGTSELHTDPISVAINEFDAVYLNYPETCVPLNDKGEKSTEINAVSQFITNWSAIELRPDTLPEDGWALVRTVIDGSTDNVPYGWLPISGFQWKNGVLAASRLFFDFGRYDNSFAYGVFSSHKEKPKVIDPAQTVTEKPLRLKVTKKVKTFKDVELPLCCGDMYDWTGYIKHPLDDKCVVQQLEYNLITQTVTATITASNTCTDNPYPDYEESEEPVTGCPSAGALIRQEESTEYLYDNPIATYYMITYKSIYADGSCGEYSSSRQEKKSTPKRGNGPR